MAYRVPNIEIPADNPYKNDVLKRKDTVEFLAGLIERAGGPFVLSLDSPYGTGKSTLVGMLQTVLSNKDFQCIYFNAWQFDYAADPLVAMVSALDEITHRDDKKYAGLKAHMGTLRKVTTSVAKRSIVAAAKAATLGILDLEPAIEKVAADLAGESTQDLVEAFQREAKQLSKFRTELQAVVGELSEIDKKETLVFFIDELDRCRPTFAIELLERVKHLFDVPNIAFVLSVDMRQLEASVAAVYGEGIDATEYLRKFIDLEFGLPQVGSKAFIELLLKKFGLEEAFAARTHNDLRQDRDNFVSFFSKLAEICKMPLRVQERSIARLQVVLDQTPSNHYLDAVLVAVLIVLRMMNRTLFSGLASGVSAPGDVVAYLKGMQGGRQLMEDHTGIVMEAMLIACDPDRERGENTRTLLRQKATSMDLTQDERNKHAHLLEMSQGIFRGSRSSIPSIQGIAKKIDIVAGSQD